MIVFSELKSSCANREENLYYCFEDWDKLNSFLAKKFFTQEVLEIKPYKNLDINPNFLSNSGNIDWIVYCIEQQKIICFLSDPLVFCYSSCFILNYTKDFLFSCENINFNNCRHVHSRGISNFTGVSSEAESQPIDVFDPKDLFYWAMNHNNNSDRLFLPPHNQDLIIYERMKKLKNYISFGYDLKALGCLTNIVKDQLLKSAGFVYYDNIDYSTNSEIEMLSFRNEFDKKMIEAENIYLSKLFKNSKNKKNNTVL